MVTSLMALHRKESDMYEAADREHAMWNFQVPPQVPDESEVKETVSCDVMVAGAGVGGLTAACRLKELGFDPLVCEKSGNYSGRGGHFGVPNSSLMKKYGIVNDLKEVARQWIAISGNDIDQELLWTFLRRSEEAMDWLLPIAEADGLQPRLVDCIYRSAPYREFYGAHSFPATGYIRGAFAPKALYKYGTEKGVSFRFNTPVTQLIKDESGRVCGAYAKGPEGIIKILAKRGVVLATGDIGGDEEMCRAYAPDALRTLSSQYIPVGCNTGDGHKMALWAGAVMAEEVFPIMMHPQHFAWCNLFFLFVNKYGKRFMNEDSYVQGRATSIMRQPDGVCYSILAGDYAEHMEESLKYGGGIFWGNAGLRYGDGWSKDQTVASVEKAIKDGFAVKADTLEELAELIDVDKAQFFKTVEEYNGYCCRKDDEAFGKRPELLFPLEKGPFVAMKIGTTLLEVVGGVQIDCSMRALGKDRKPIPGLYVIGDTSGGMYGHEYVTTILGNSHGRAVTWGYLAAETIAAE